MKHPSKELLLSAMALVGKCLLLALADGLSVWIVFAAAPTFHLKNFPWALVHLLAVLLIADMFVLIYPYLRRRYGLVYSRGWAYATAALYLVAMLLTFLFYWRIPTPLLAVCVVAFLLVYAGTIAGILLTRKRRQRRRDTPVNGGAIAVGMLELGNSVHRLQDILEPRQWTALNKAYMAARNCWELAAPFGYSDLSAVNEMEGEIARRVTQAAQLTSSLLDAPDKPAEATVQEAARLLLDTADRLNLREKLLFG